jgi:hypothetical protein
MQKYFYSLLMLLFLSCFQSALKADVTLYSITTGTTYTFNYPTFSTRNSINNFQTSYNNSPGINIYTNPNSYTDPLPSDPSWQSWSKGGTPVPEPATLLTLGAGAIALMACKRRKNNTVLDKK